MGIGKKILVGLAVIVGLIGVLFTGFRIFLALNSGDIGKPDDSVLRPSSVIVPKEENAFYDLKQAADSLVLVKADEQVVLDMSNGKNWNDALANKIVNDNTAAFAAFDRASWKKSYQDTAVQVDPKTLNADTELTSTSKVRQVAQVSVIKSMLLFRQGKEKEAFDNTLNILYVGQMLENSPRTNLIGFLVGMSIKGRGIKNIQTMAQTRRLSSGELKAYASKIEKFKGNTMGLQEAFRMEYTKEDNTREQALLKSNYYYKPNETQKLFIDLYQGYVDSSVRLCSEIRPHSIQVERSVVGVLFTENAIGKILVDVLGSSLNGAFMKRCEEEFSVIQTQITLASQAYKVDKGAYPTSLTQLAPEYLPQVSEAYNGKPITYDANTGIVSLPK